MQIRRLILLVTLLLVCHTISAQKLYRLYHLADSFYSIKAYKTSISYYEKLYKSATSKSLFSFNISNIYYELGDTSQFIQYLIKTIEFNPWNYYFFYQTPTRKLSESNKVLIEEAFKKSKVKHDWKEPKDSVLARKLKTIRDRDQFYRNQIAEIQKTDTIYTSFKKKFDSLFRFQNKSDALNQRILDTLIQQYGWIDLRNADFVNMETEWLVIQHSHYSKKRKRYVKMMQRSARAHNYPYRFVAHCIDYANIDRHRPQRFYTAQVFGYGHGFHNENQFTRKQLEKINSRRLNYGMLPIYK